MFLWNSKASKVMSYTPHSFQMGMTLLCWLCYSVGMFGIWLDVQLLRSWENQFSNLILWYNHGRNKTKRNVLNNYFCTHQYSSPLGVVFFSVLYHVHKRHFNTSTSVICLYFNCGNKRSERQHILSKHNNKIGYVYAEHFILSYPFTIDSCCEVKLNTYFINMKNIVFSMWNKHACLTL